MDPSQAQVKVLFTTTHADIELPEEKRQLLVPADIKRYGLSRIVNSESMLNSSTPIPLDFLVNGAFLRSSLAEHLTTHGLSPETTITLQYVPSLLPPVYEASYEHDDWISDIDLWSSGSRAGSERLLSASYDRLLRVWDKSGSVLGTSAGASAGGHAKRINTARWLSGKRIASAGIDSTVIVWDYSEATDGFSEGGKLKPVLELHGHTKQINRLAVDSKTKRILTAGSDGCIGLFVASKDQAPAWEAERASAPAKRLKSSVTVAQRGALAMLSVHSDPAMQAIFHPGDNTVAYSVSRDKTLLTLDLTTGRTVSSLTTLHPLLCVGALGVSSPLLAAGSSARHISLLDPRESTAAPNVLTLRGHTNMVSAVAAAPGKDYALASASWDGTVKIWDLRSVRPGSREEGGGSVSEPIFTIPREWLKGKKLPEAGEGAKVLALAWDDAWGLASGGEDKKVQLNTAGDLSLDKAE
ncbi:Ribosome biogenesis protein YTM1 [Ceratocystis lukuohia]|uniref:Ribosome biogenesis protein YTM1 n=1 Tax=Ceratocystis lukuohia TaxID=2019550 RepID=A0ABR4MJW5_9PEZI